MFELDVKVQGDIGAVDFIALFVGTGKILLDFCGETSIFLSVF